MSDNNNTTTVETTKEIKGNTVVSFTLPQPQWTVWVFRIVFLVTSAATLVIAGDDAITDANKVRILLYMKAFDFIIWGIGKGLGVDKKQFADVG